MLIFDKQNSGEFIQDTGYHRQKTENQQGRTLSTGLPGTVIGLS